MYKFKQIVALVLCFAMLVPLVGCKKDDSSKTDIQLPDTFMPEDISISEEDVVYEDNTLYADSQILLTVQSGTPYETVEKLVHKEGGEIIGFINFSGDYHIDFPEGKSHEDLNTLIQIWSEKDFIENVSLNFVHRASTDSVPYENDPWLDTSLDSDKKQDTDWDEANSDGNNWWIEAIRMPTVWEMPVWDSYDFTPVKIGIIDSVFDEFHVDLDNVLLKTWENVDPTNTSLSLEEDEIAHGTHVAGIIGAEIGNRQGISGVAACAKPMMYGFATKGTDSHLYRSLMEDKYAYSLMFENGIRVINMSMGHSELLVAAQKADQQGITNDATKQLMFYSSEMERFFKKAIDAGFDFLIIKSAGNESDKQWVSCPITAEHPYGYRKAKAGEKGERGVWSVKYNLYGRITDPDVKSHIIIVGAARKSDWVDFWSGNGSGTGYLRAEFSNIDCDVYAPGVDILSTVPGDGTDKLQGTSMSTPMVTGIAGLIWSVNPDLSAKQVKDIIILSSTYKALEENSKTSEDVLIVDAAFAVNMALEWDVAEYQDAERPSCMMGTVYVELTDSAGTSKRYVIRKADIRITSADGQTVTMLSDEDLGTFDVFLSEGEYRISVKAEGFQDYEDTVILREGDVKYLSVKMVPLETELLSSIDAIDSIFPDPELYRLPDVTEVPDDNERTDVLTYPISEELCYVIYERRFGHPMEDGAERVEVSRFGSGDNESICFNIYSAMDTLPGMPEFYFIVYVNTGKCEEGVPTGHSFTFSAEEYFSKETAQDKPVEEGFAGNQTVEQLRKSIVGSWGEEGSVVSDYDFNSDGTCYWFFEKQTEGTYKIRDDKMLLITFPWMNDRYFWTEETYEEWRSHSSDDCWYMTDSGVLILNGVSYYRDGKVIKDYNTAGGLLETIAGTWVLDDFMEYRFFTDGTFEENMVSVSHGMLLDRIDIDSGPIEIIDDTHAKLWNEADSFGEIPFYIELVYDPETDTLCIGGSNNVYHRAKYSD